MALPANRFELPAISFAAVHESELISDKLIIYSAQRQINADNLKTWVKGETLTLKNKLLISSNCIEIQCERDDIATQQLLTDFYPVTSNRIKTSFKLSPHLVPEVLKAFRNLDESNIHTAPQKIQDLLLS